MRAIIIEEPGGPEVLRLGEHEDPTPGPGEVLIAVAATAVNRADLMQRAGHYPPPRGASDILGLECSGRIVALGADVTGWQLGDEVCALLAGGGYAELVAVPAGQLLPVPAGVDLISAAALPEVACTVWSMVFDEARLSGGESLLVHGGSSGIGTMAIQLATAIGARVFATAGSAAKVAACQQLGAEVAINYREQDFADVITDRTAGGGIDVILDTVGAKYLHRNLAVLALDGRIVNIGLVGGRKAELDLSLLMAKRGLIYSAGLRARPSNQKSAIVAGTQGFVWPLVASGAVRPVIHDVLPLAEAAKAHELVESSTHIGKVVLTP
jgi:putative PIG3 family NAD(P)H quinone oxidoreductase